MDFKFSKDRTDGEVSAQSQEKGKQTGMIVLLLILLGGFGYLYFFTGLIRPQEPPPAPTQPPQVVKQPLPSRDAAPAVKLPQKPVDSKIAVASAVKSEERKPEPAKSVAKQDPPKTAVVPADRKPESDKPVAPAVTKAEPKKVAPAKVEVKKVVAVDAVAQAKPSSPAKKQSATPKTVGPWTVVVGLYVVEETLAEDMAKVKKAGLTPVMTSGPKRSVAMNRLFYGEYSSKEQAQQAVETLRRTAGSGFSLQRGEKHEVYAGSYAVPSGAQAEQQRLAASGVKVSIRKAQVPLSSRKLTAGTFTDRKTAIDAQKKLKSAGIGTPEIE